MIDQNLLHNRIIERPGGGSYGRLQLWKRGPVEAELVGWALYFGYWRRAECREYRCRLTTGTGSRMKSAFRILSDWIGYCSICDRRLAFSTTGVDTVAYLIFAGRLRQRCGHGFFRKDAHAVPFAVPSLDARSK
jgi:hypothetical protein